MFGLHRQRGLSAIGWLFVITVFGFSFLVVSKLAPHYLDNRFVVAALKELSENPKLGTMSTKEIRSELNKTFLVNNIRGKPTKSVDISKSKKGIVVTIEYEERIKFMANADVLLTFSSYLDSRKPELCCRPPENVNQQK